MKILDVTRRSIGKQYNFHVEVPKRKIQKIIKT
jgi:hypothetical protein